MRLAAVAWRVVEYQWRALMYYALGFNVRKFARLDKEGRLRND